MRRWLSQRLTDFVAVLLLCLGGALSAQYGMEVVAIAGVLSILAIGVLSSERTALSLLNILRSCPIGGLVPTLREAYTSMRILVRPSRYSCGLGDAGLWLECVALYLVLLASTEPAVGPLRVHLCICTLAGAVTMLPGGSLYRGSMIALLTVVTPFLVTDDRLLPRQPPSWFVCTPGLPLDLEFAMVGPREPFSAPGGG